MTILKGLDPEVEHMFQFKEMVIAHTCEAITKGKNNKSSRYDNFLLKAVKEIPFFRNLAITQPVRPMITRPEV